MGRESLLLQEMGGIVTDSQAKRRKSCLKAEMELSAEKSVFVNERPSQSAKPRTLP